MHSASSHFKQAKQLRNVQRFNVVNHSPMYQDATDPKEKPPQPHPYRKKIASDFNIISNRSYSNNNSSSQDATATASPNRPSSKRPTREFNILTNKYVLGRWFSSSFLVEVALMLTCGLLCCI